MVPKKNCNRDRRIMHTTINSSDEWHQKSIITHLLLHRLPANPFNGHHYIAHPSLTRLMASTVILGGNSNSSCLSRSWPSPVTLFTHTMGVMRSVRMDVAAVCTSDAVRHAYGILRACFSVLQTAS